MSDKHRSSGRAMEARPGLTPEQAANVQQRALAWRQQWQVERAANGQPVAPRSKERPAVSAEAEAKRRARYASQVARSEFGRFYWNEELGRRMEAELRQSLSGKREAQSRRLEQERASRRK